MLNIYRADRADSLVEALGDLMVKPLDDPIAAEIIAVPTRGVERWLAQRLSARLGAAPGHCDGVCANVEFPFPGRLVGEAVAAAAGIDRDTDPWLPQRLVWPLLDAVDQCLNEPWLAALAAHIGATGSPPGAERRARRFSTVRHIANLFDRYAVHRPEMLCAWASGADVDGSGRPLPADTIWQAELWRRLRNRVDEPSPAERLVVACERLRGNGALVNLPPRLSLFGLTRLPASHLQVIAALGIQRDVHLFLLHPSPALWERVEIATNERPRIARRAEDLTVALPRNPLLASWGQDAREMQLVLSRDRGASDDHHRPVGEPANTLLARIQADVRADQSPPGVPLPLQEDTRQFLDPEDKSLQIHSCHGAGRQVEVVRDAVLHLLAADATLEARDVIVMCPDIETYSPLIHATFGSREVDDEVEFEEGAGQSKPSPDLRVRLADRSLRQTNLVLGVVAEVLELVPARLTAAQLLDLASREPVRRRFRLDDADLSRLENLVGETGVRWGLDAAHREPFQLGWLDANSWHAGLDRILLGVAAGEEGQRLFGGVLPLDDVAGGDVDLIGRFAELVDRLHATLTALAEPKGVDAWAESIGHAADSLTATGGTDAWQRAQLQRILDDIVTEATEDGTVNTSPLALPEIRFLLADRLRGRPTRANFRTGHLTVCTLVPMRSVPHRVICLMGLDDGVFPRRTARDGDDIILNDPHLGDRDARTEDRQLLLDALMAATDALVITYSGRDERTNAELPPAVVVGELLEVVDRTVRSRETADDGQPVPARLQVTVHHPLQPFDVRNYTIGALVPGRAWSFDAISLDGARALCGDRLAKPPFLTGPLPAVGKQMIELDKLEAFVQHPAKAFLRQRLGLILGDYSRDVRNDLPIDLDALEKWGIGNRLLEARLGGGDAQACLEAEIARGILPPDALASAILASITLVVERILVEVSALTSKTSEPRSIEVNLLLPNGRSLMGTVPNLRSDLMLTAAFSRVAPKHRLAAWVRFLAVTATHPDHSFEAATIGRNRSDSQKKRQVTIARLALAGTPAERKELSLAHLTKLVDLYDRGMREPLPLYCATSAAYRGAPKPKIGLIAARKAWESEWNFNHEDKDLEHLLVLNGIRSFDELLMAPACQDETGRGWATDEKSRFGRYSRRLWDGLLASEKMIDL